MFLQFITYPAECGRVSRLRYENLIKFRFNSKIYVI